MRQRSFVLVALFAVLTVPALAAGSDADMPVFTVESAEVHLTFTAVGDHNNVVSKLSPSDFRLLQDGVRVRNITSFTPLTDAPFSLVVLTDVSESMNPVMPMVKKGWFRLTEDVFGKPDTISFVDFGSELQGPGTRKSKVRLTSMYDSSIELVRNWKLEKGRRAVLLITDGQDNYSFNDVFDLVDIASKYEVAFYTISFARTGTKGDAALRYLAAKTGGQHFPVRKQKEVVHAMQSVESELGKAFEVTFHIENNDAGVHQLAMQSTNGTLKFYHRDSYFQPLARMKQVAVARP